MGNSIAKKTIILYVLFMLEEASSNEIPISILSMTKVINSLGVKCDRKTVSRNVGYLIDFGYPIVKTKGGGCYLDGKLDASKIWRNIPKGNDE